MKLIAFPYSLNSSSQAFLKLPLASLDYPAFILLFAFFLSHYKVPIISSLINDAWRLLHQFLYPKQVSSYDYPN